MCVYNSKEISVPSYITIINKLHISCIRIWVKKNSFLRESCKISSPHKNYKIHHIKQDMVSCFARKSMMYLNFIIVLHHILYRKYFRYYLRIE